MAVAALGGGGLFSGLLGKLISFAISSIFQSLFAPDEPEQPEPEGPLLNKRSNTSPIPVIYGTRRVGGNRVFVATEGAKNEFLHIVLLVCEGEIDGFEKIYIDDQELRFSGSLTENTSLTPIGAVENNESGNPMDTDKFSGDRLVRIRLHHGALDQSVDGELMSAFPTTWTSQHKLQGRAYIYARFRYDQDTFGGMPTLQADIRGKRITLLPGTSGIMVSEPARLGYSNNPALCLRDYLTNDDYGRGLDPATIDDDAIVDAANYCDSSITLQFGEPAADGSTSSTGTRYTMDGIVETDATLYENTQRILTHMRGFLVFSSGLYKLVLDNAVDSQEFIYDESNIIGSLSVSLGSKKNTLNRMRATFWNPTKNGEDDTIILEPTAIDPADGQRRTIKEILDNGVTLSREIQLPYCNNPHSARYLVNQEIEQSRQQIHVTFKVGLAGLRNEIGDVVRLQHAQMGWGYRTVVVDGDVVLVKNSVITIGNLGQTGIIENWNPSDNYATIGKAVSYLGAIFVSRTVNNQGNIPPSPTITVDDPLTPGVDEGLNENTDWKQAKRFSDITNLGQFGIIDADDDGKNDTNIGIDGKFLYKEFRILSLSLKAQEEVEISAIEYDDTVFDRFPLSAEDATSNTSFQNPNSIGPPTNLTTTEELYVTTNSGGVKAALTLNWDSPNTPFVQAYDVFVHIPEQTYSTVVDYPVDTIVTFNDNRFISIVFNGPTSATNGVDTAPDNATFWSPITEIRDQDYVYLTRTRTQSATVFDAVPGNYAVRIKSVSVTGVRSLDLQSPILPVQGLIAPPQDITGFGITPQTDLALLQWNPSEDLDVRIGGNIQVRHSPGQLTTQTPQEFWSAAPILTEGKSGVTTQILVPLLTGTYMIKAVDSSGVESVTPAVIINTIEPSTIFEFINGYSEQTAWLGVTTPAGGASSSTGVEVFDNRLRLNTGGGTAADSAPVTLTGTYNFGQIVEFASPTETRLNSTVTASAANVDNFLNNLAEDGNWDGLGRVFGNENVPNSTVVLEVSTTDDDPAGSPMYSPYVQFTSGTFTFRAARFRIRITTTDLTTQVFISEATVGASAAAVTQSNSNLSWNATDVAAGFKDVSYTNNFFNDASIGFGSFADPFLGISADGLVPGQYFTITNNYDGTNATFCQNAGGTYSGNSCSISESGAPQPWEGFRIKFQRVNTTAGTCTGGTADGTVVTRNVCEAGGGTITGIVQLNAPRTTDGLVSASGNIQFDYRSTGF